LSWYCHDFADCDVGKCNASEKRLKGCLLHIHDHQGYLQQNIGKVGWSLYNPLPSALVNSTDAISFKIFFQPLLSTSPITFW